VRSLRISRLLRASLFAASVGLVWAGSAGSVSAQTSAPAAAASAVSATGTPPPAGSALVHVSGCSTKHAGAGELGSFQAPEPPAGQASNTSFTTVYGDGYYQPVPGSNGPVMLITFTNITNKPMTMVEFGLLSNEILSGEARDTGTFSPGAEIKSKLGISLKAILPGSTRCVPLKITFADGTTWRNPRLPKRGEGYFNSKYPPKPM
jgi:hypothetical protein